jgi:hypothetical protein
MIGQERESRMIKIGDRVQVGSRIGADPAWAVVVDIIPANDYREALYRVRFDIPVNRDGRRSEIVTITPNPNECWVDEGIVFGPFLEQN